MIWSPIVVSILIAIFFTMLLVIVLGWRRPDAPADEGALISGAFFFILLFLALWASSVWLRPWGPEVWGVPWAALLVFAAVMALLIGAGMGSSLRSSRESRAHQGATSGSPGAVSAAYASREAAEGFGLMFWILAVLLLLAAVVGTI